MGKNLPMGSTESGKAWCIKALHPSDPLTEVRGVPDESSMSTVFLNYQSTFTLQPPGVAEPTWSFDAALLPHPVNFLTTQKSYSSGATPSSTSFLNAQLTGSTHTDKFATFLSMCEKWRLAYMSVTVYQDGAALTDQGTMVACQVPVRPRVVNGTSNLLTIGALSYMFLQPESEQFQERDQPMYERSQAMPNAYFNRSKEGCYLPLKLSRDAAEWKGVNDARTYIVPSEPGDAWMNDTVWYLQRNGQVNANFVAAKANYDALTGAWPYFGLKQLTRVGTWAPASGESASNFWVGEYTSPLCNGNVGHISGRGISTASTLQFFVRCGFEVQVQPSSVLSPELRLSPPHDDMALDAYYAISRELKDAYPADYNDLGKIWDVIKKAAVNTLPLLRHVPYVGPFAEVAERALTKPGYTPARGSRDTISASDLERARAAIATNRRGNKPRRK
jgi:hypothetical protein